MTTTDEARVTDERRKFMEGVVNIARNEREFLHCCSFDDLAEALIDYADRLAARDTTLDRLSTVVDEAFGLQPVQSPEELVSTLERLLFDDRQKWDARDAELAKLRELMSEARSMVTGAAAFGVTKSASQWLAKIDAARRGTP